MLFSVAPTDNLYDEPFEIARKLFSVIYFRVKHNKSEMKSVEGLKN
jgi:hypothetical protein